MLHHGADGAAGDIGHVRVRGGPDDPCVCGNVGCIEAVASASAIARRLAEPSADGAVVTIADLRARLGKPIRPRSGWSGRRPRTSVSWWPCWCTSTTRPGSPIGGSLTAASDDLLAGVRSVVYQRALPLATRNLVLANSTLGEYAGLAGAAVLGIERALSAPEIGTLSA